MGETSILRRIPTDLIPLRDKVVPSETALLVVDVQNDFCASDGALARTGAEIGPAQEAAARIERMIELARAAGVLVVFVRLVGEPATESPAWVDQRIRRAGAPYKPWATPDSVGADFYLVKPLPNEPVVDKYRYSSFEGTKLEYVLRKRGIRTIVASGVASNVCVETAVREAFMRDFFVVMLSDSSAGTSVEAHVAALENLGRFFCQVVSSEEVAAIWRSSSADVASAPESSLAAVR